MKLWTILSNAVFGWVLLARNQPGWRERFTISAAGLVTALFIFAFIAFLAVALTSMSIGMPSAIGVAAAMFVLALPITGLVVTLLATRLLLKSDTAALPVLVPGVYASSAFLLLEGILAMIGGPVVMLAWLGLAYLLFQLARAATGWSVGVAAAFAVLTIVLLVAMRLALYMLSTLAAGSPL